MRLIHPIALAFSFGLRVDPALAQERPHQRRAPHLPDDIREQIHRKYKRQEQVLTNVLTQRQVAVDNHLSGRKLLDDKVGYYRRY